MNWYLQALSKYAVFGGRSHRTEYWMFVLFNLIFAIGLGFVDGLFGTGGILGLIYNLAILIPALAVSVRRLHDTNRSGWWLLIGLVPVIGVIVLILFFVMDSDPGNNEYGANPKAS
jgi:uncharacterized membrane protein YhaH (DUF805 family)